MPGFGKDDLLICPECGKEMRLIRRSPHPEHGEAYEAQIFACDDGHEALRSADIKGDPHTGVPRERYSTAASGKAS